MNVARLLMLIGFVGLALPGVAMVVWARAESAALLGEPVPVEHPPRTISEPVSLERGEHLVRHVLDCGGCHGDDLAGKPVLDHWMLGQFYAPNLTTGEGGLGGELTTEGWDKAIRHGVGPDNRPLIYHPARRYAALSDQDLESVIRYLEQVPPKGREMLDSRPGPMFRLLLAAGVLQLDARLVDHSATHRWPEAGATAEYGAYLARLAGCHDCHGSQLEGRLGPPGAPAAPAIHQAALQSWSRVDLGRALRDGVTPSGQRLSPYMPWPAYEGLTEDEVTALWRYLQGEGPPDG